MKIEPPAHCEAQSIEGLTEAQLTAIDLLLFGVKFAQIAAQLHIDVRTLYNWRTQNPLFRAELQRRREDLLAHASDRFRSLLDSSLDTLERQVADRYAPTAHRAAKTLLSLARIGDYLSPASSVPADDSNDKDCIAVKMQR